jgi:hypothetical protein
MEAKHTPGPWFVKEQNNTMNAVWSNKRYICTAYTGGAINKPGIKQALANARLIASAPELLEALKEAQSYICKLKKSIKDPDYFHIQAVMASARSKAEGRA